MPEKVWAHSMVASPGNEAVYSFGGYPDAKNKIFKFSCPDDQIQNCQWELLEFQLDILFFQPMIHDFPPDSLLKIPGETIQIFGRKSRIFN